MAPYLALLGIALRSEARSKIWWILAIAASAATIMGCLIQVPFWDVATLKAELVVSISVSAVCIGAAVTAATGANLLRSHALPLDPAWTPAVLTIARLTYCVAICCVAVATWVTLAGRGGDLALVPGLVARSLAPAPVVVVTGILGAAVGGRLVGALGALIVTPGLVAIRAAIPDSRGTWLQLIPDPMQSAATMSSVVAVLAYCFLGLAIAALATSFEARQAR